jgi:hypothetical protein
LQRAETICWYRGRVESCALARAAVAARFAGGVDLGIDLIHSELVEAALLGGGSGFAEPGGGEIPFEHLAGILFGGKTAGLRLCPERERLLFGKIDGQMHRMPSFNIMALWAVRIQRRFV